MLQSVLEDLATRFKRAIHAFLNEPESEPFLTGLHLVPDTLPDLPPGCTFRKETCGWAVLGTDGEILTIDLAPADGATIAWEIYNSFEHPGKSKAPEPEPDAS